MRMTVVQVRVVRMRVADGRVPVGVGMRAVAGRALWVLVGVVSVVLVAVVM